MVPDEVGEKIDKICEELRISVQDIMLRAIVKVIEEFEKKPGRGRRRGGR